MSIDILEQRFKSSLSVNLGGEINEELPQSKNIRSISIRHNTGTLDVGNYQANSIFKRIWFELDGNVIIDIGGEKFADNPSTGVRIFRDFMDYRQGYNAKTRNERFDYVFKDCLPAGAIKRVHVEFESDATAISDGLATSYTGATLDIYYTEGDGLPDGRIIERTKSTSEIIGTNTEGEVFIPEVKGNEFLTALLLAYDDNNAYSNIAPDIKLTVGNTVYFHGKWADLLERCQKLGNISMATGNAILELPPLQFGSSDIKLEYSLANAPTAGKLHIWLITEEAILNK